MRTTAILAATVLFAASTLLADSIEEAVARLEAACKAGDLEALARGFGKRGGPLMRQLVASMRAQDCAADEWRKALDERFGADPKARAEIGIAEQLAAGFSLVQHIAVAQQVQDGPRTRLTLKVTRKDRLNPDATLDVDEEWIGEIEDGAWGLVPKGFFEDIEAMQADQERMGRILEAAARVREQVVAGKFATREEAEKALDEATRPIREEGRPAAEPWADPEVLQATLKAAIEALQKDDYDAAKQTMEGLVLPEAPLWFEDTFGVVNGAKASAAYDAEQVVVNLIATLSSAIEAGRIDPWVYTLTSDEDDHTAAVYAAMARPFDLIVVDLNTPGQFQGGTRVAYFAFVDGAFRYIGDLADIAR